VIFWVCSNPWIGPPRPNKDRWQSYTTERREIADFLKANAIRNLCILSADMHALAYDDGSNSDYATGGGLPIPVLQAAPLAQFGSRKGGPYSSGRPIMKAGQYGIVEVSDDGASPLSVTFFGKRFDREPPTLLTYRFTVQ
jgi:alkaline phosphatase D